VWLVIVTDGRFPEVESVIPDRTTSVATMELSGDDIAFVRRALPRLPGNQDSNGPVTLDCNGSIALRARAEDQKRPTELPGGPVLSSDDRRQYVWMGLEKEAIVAPDEDPIRIMSDQAAPVDRAAVPSTNNTRRRRKSTVTQQESASVSRQDGRRRDASKAAGPDLVQEAEALKAALRDAYQRTCRLVVSVKRYRRHTQIMRSTIASLRELAPLEQE
jgi:hypothetical protein